jgi:hypothetical protein
MIDHSLMHLQDRIRAGDLTPEERKMLWRLVGVVADSKVETNHTADAWLHVVQERYDDLLAVTPQPDTTTSTLDP